MSKFKTMYKKTMTDLKKLKESYGYEIDEDEELDSGGIVSTNDENFHKTPVFKKVVNVIQSIVGSEEQESAWSGQFEIEDLPEDIDWATVFVTDEGILNWVVKKGPDGYAELEVEGNIIKCEDPDESFEIFQGYSDVDVDGALATKPTEEVKEKFKLPSKKVIAAKKKEFEASKKNK